MQHITLECLSFFRELEFLTFSRPLFLAFFVLVFTVYWLTPSYRLRKWWLLVCSYTFYATWDYRFLSLILISTLVDFQAGRGIVRARSNVARRAWLIASLSCNLGILGFFKYFHFFEESTVQLLNACGLAATSSTLQIVLPVGISFYTFQTMSYTLDVFFGKLQPCRRLTDFALFVAFFPQLVAGPIVRAKSFLPQLLVQPRWRSVPLRSCLTLFLVGLIKKSCIADQLAGHIDPVFGTPELYAASAIWCAALLYAVQIYCDFSGYSDMAIACAGLLGFALPKNFDFPYFATNISDFWRRWHISLSSWLRDYLYIPLGGSRGPAWYVARNLMLTMLLGGLWHGARWTFVIWGGMHGLALTVCWFWRRWQPDCCPGKFPLLRQLASMACNFYFVSLLWLLFRCESFETAWSITQSFVLCSSEGVRQLPPILWLAFAVLAALHAATYRWPVEKVVQTLPDWLVFVLLPLGYLLAFALAPVGAPPFIYFQF